MKNEFIALFKRYTREEALRNIREVVEMTIESIIEDGEPIPKKGVR